MNPFVELRRVLRRHVSVGSMFLMVGLAAIAVVLLSTLRPSTPTLEMPIAQACENRPQSIAQQNDTTFIMVIPARSEAIWRSTVGMTVNAKVRRIGGSPARMMIYEITVVDPKLASTVDVTITDGCGETSFHQAMLATP